MIKQNLKIPCIPMVTTRILDRPLFCLQAIQDSPDICTKELRRQWLILERFDEQKVPLHIQNQTMAMI